METNRRQGRLFKCHVADNDDGPKWAPVNKTFDF